MWFVHDYEMEATGWGVRADIAILYSFLLSSSFFLLPFPVRVRLCTPPSSHFHFPPLQREKEEKKNSYDQLNSARCFYIINRRRRRSIGGAKKYRRRERERETIDSRVVVYTHQGATALAVQCSAQASSRLRDVPFLQLLLLLLLLEFLLISDFFLVVAVVVVISLLLLLLFLLLFIVSWRNKEKRKEKKRGMPK